MSYILMMLLSTLGANNITAPESFTRDELREIRREYVRPYRRQLRHKIREGGEFGYCDVIIGSRCTDGTCNCHGYGWFAYAKPVFGRIIPMCASCQTTIENCLFGSLCTRSGFDENGDPQCICP